MGNEVKWKCEREGERARERQINMLYFLPGDGIMMTRKQRNIPKTSGG